MRQWMFLLGGLIVWTAHFFAVYGAASIFPGSDAARMLTLAATILALGANVVLLWLAAARRLGTNGDGLRFWITDVAAIGAILSFIAVLWQALPAIIM